MKRDVSTASSVDTLLAEESDIRSPEALAYQEYLRSCVLNRRSLPIIIQARASGKMERLRYLAMRHKVIIGGRVFLHTPSGVKEL